MDSSTSNKLTRANYTFTADAEISTTGTTHVPFVSPRAPFSITFVVPTVLRQFGPLNASIHPIEPTNGSGTELPQPLSRAQSRAPSVPPFQQDAGPRGFGSRAPSVAPAELQGRSSRASSVAPRQLTPGPAAPGLSSRGSTPASVPSSPIPASSTRSTRSATAAQREMEHAQMLDKFPAQTTASGVIRRPQSVPPANFEDYLPPRSTPASQRSASPAPTAAATSSKLVNHGLDEGWDFDPMTAKRWTRPCAKSDEEKLKAASRKGKAPEENHETAWFQSRAAKPIVSPPDELSLRPDLELGDVFYHRSDQGIQLWMRVEDPTKGAYWKPSLLGEKREEDGRFLALTPGSKPTWNGKAWYRKKQASQRTSGITSSNLISGNHALKARVFILSK
ncbi:hypothetical protein TRAPUB_7211 [Trametes pubescens]|uniref:Uncharacterized protein n=1 Tax=Trametes pubescens TaxID=154538 RepID=A0A1M2W6P1_TRAPU|nr:hypothetical protein TRAPUB_7211 [Trametes pubescens]